MKRPDNKRLDDCVHSKRQMFVRREIVLYRSTIHTFKIIYCIMKLRFPLETPLANTAVYCRLACVHSDGIRGAETQILLELGSTKNVHRPRRKCRSDSVLRRFNLRVCFALFRGALFLPGFLPPLPVNNVKYFE